VFKSPAKFDGAPCAVKVACTVWSGGKSGDYFKGLPIAIRCQVTRDQTAYGELDVNKSGKEKHNPDGTGDIVKKYL